MIENYGLFWKREAVHWNEGGKGRKLRGHLKGIFDWEGDRWIVDFREQIGIYCLYDDNFRLVYVGQAGFGRGNLFNRLLAHCRDGKAERWTKFSWFGLKAVDGEPEINQLADSDFDTIEIGYVLNALEGVLIAGAEPPLNRQGPRFQDAEQYRQLRDDEAVYPSVEEMIQDIWDSLPET